MFDYTKFESDMVNIAADLGEMIDKSTVYGVELKIEMGMRADRVTGTCSIAYSVQDVNTGARVLCKSLPEGMRELIRIMEREKGMSPTVHKIPVMDPFKDQGGI